MARFLSAEWLDDAAAAVAAGGQASGIGPDVSLTVQQVVQGAPEGEVAYSVRFDAGRIHLTPGVDGDADIEVRSRYETAVAISLGHLSPALALETGDLRVRGKVGLLAENRDAWAALDDLLAPVRAATEY